MSRVKYHVLLRIEGLPKPYNAITHMHWYVKKQIKDKAQKAIKEASEGMRPAVPLTKAKLICRRHSCKAPDFEGLVSSFKHLIDGLVVHKILIDDNMDIIGKPDFRWLKAPRGKGFIEIEIEEL